jgi:site-specific DNA recombinase
MSGAPYGYRYIKKADHCDAYWEIDEIQAEIVREVFTRYVQDGVSIGELARWLTDRGVPTKTGKARWDRSSVWAMLRNPAYRGQAAFGKTKTSERHAGPTRTTRQRGERHGRRLTRQDQPAEKWTFIPVPPLITEETFELAQARLVDNARFSTRNTKQLSLLGGVLVCRECGYAYYRTWTRTSNKRISYYRCIGQDGWRHPDGKRCTSRPVRADELDPLVWDEVRRLLEHPELVQAEIDRRISALRTEHPAARRRETLERDIARADSATARLIEGLPGTADLARRAPRPHSPAAQAPEHPPSATQRTRRRTARRRHLPQARRHPRKVHRPPHRRSGPAKPSLADQQRVLRLVVREVLIGGDDDTITIRYSIPTPTGPNDPGYLLRGSSPLAPVVQHRAGRARPRARPAWPQVRSLCR